MEHVRRIALVGFGEVGRILGEDLPRPGLELLVHDLRFADPESGASRAAAEARAVRALPGPEGVAAADLVISAVTASEAEAAALALVPHLRPGAWYLDLNSVSPQTKRRLAGLVAAARGRFVEAAVMSPILPKRLGAPVLLGGLHAEIFLPLAEELGFSTVSVFSDRVGDASAVKMCRSVVVKGIEALFQESLLAARFHGVEKEVLASLIDLFPSHDREALGQYLIGRTLQHGLRRAEEMREVARTVADAGLDPVMSEATALRQDWGPRFAAALGEDVLGRRLDAIRAAMTALNQKDAAE